MEDLLNFVMVIFWAGVVAWFATGVITVQQERINWEKYAREHNCKTAGDETIWRCDDPLPRWIIREKQ